MTMVGCQQHFISDKKVRESVQAAFEERRALFTEGEVFDLFEEELSTEEREALEFLYSTMSSADMGDYEAEYFLDNVRMSLRVREEMAWGKDVPEDLFRHFVLPIRVNNERLDEFRMAYYDELKARSPHLPFRLCVQWVFPHVRYIRRVGHTPTATMRG